MDTAGLSAARAQFTFTIMFHYLFPILTMGLGVLIAVLKTLELRVGDGRYGAAARFWAGIFAINFTVGVVTGIPMEFQFGTNWAAFSRYSGGVIGQTLAMEGTYAFFMESGFLGLFLFGEKRVSAGIHWLASVLVAGGALLSGYFIVATNAWMQHPVGYAVTPDGAVRLTSLWSLLTNPFAGWEYAHAIVGSLVTASMVMAGTGAYYTLVGMHRDFARISIRVGVISGLVFALLQLFPTGDKNAENVTHYQPAKQAAMEGLFHTEYGAPLAIIGMPDEPHQRLIDPIELPDLLSYLSYGNTHAEVKGLESYPAALRPPVSITYYSYHIMVGLGTLFIALMGVGVLLLRGDRILRARLYLWALMLAVPLPYIANEAGWTVTEVGRQPWLVYGLQRTAAGVSPNVSAGETIFTLIGFSGIYFLLGILFLALVARKLAAGPDDPETVTGGARLKVPQGV